MVKADAYGCGIEQVTRGAARAGCKTFFVAHLAEARARARRRAGRGDLRAQRAFPPAPARPSPTSSAAGDQQPRSSSPNGTHFVRASGWRGGAALHVDTGMNRLGFTHRRGGRRSRRASQPENHGITLVMSHLACAEQPEHPLNDQQIRQFREVRALFRGIAGSLANSSGIFLGASTYCDLVRPGVALYGGNPTPGKPNPMRPVVELKARILQVRDVDARARPSATARPGPPSAPSRIAIVAAGYADGYLARRGDHRRRKPAREVDRRRQALPDRRAASRWT